MRSLCLGCGLRLGRGVGGLRLPLSDDCLGHSRACGLGHGLGPSLSLRPGARLRLRLGPGRGSCLLGRDAGRFARGRDRLGDAFALLFLQPGEFGPRLVQRPAGGVALRVQLIGHHGQAVPLPGHRILRLAHRLGRRLGTAHRRVLRRARRVGAFQAVQELLLVVQGEADRRVVHATVDVDLAGDARHAAALFGQCGTSGGQLRGHVVEAGLRLGQFGPFRDGPVGSLGALLLKFAHAGLDRGNVARVGSGGRHQGQRCSG